jgi:CRISPR type III-A-associated protein Csm2
MNYQTKGSNTDTRHALEKRVHDILSMDTHPNIDSLLDDIRSYAFDYGKKLNTSQLRNIFSKVLGVKEPNELKMLRPRIIYVAARQQNPESKRIVEFFESIIPKVDDVKKVKNYQAFMEAFVAYHKYQNPK